MTPADGLIPLSPLGPFPQEGTFGAPVGPFRRSDPTKSGQRPPAPTFWLIAIDPELYARGAKRLKLRHAAMVTGAFAMIGLGVGIQPAAVEVAPKPARADDTIEMKKPSKRPGDKDDAEGPGVADAADKTVLPATAPTERPPSEAVAAPATEQPPKKEKPAPAPEPAPWEAVPIVEFGGVVVYEISEHIQLVGLHEAAYNVALPLTPMDPPAANHGRARVNSHAFGFKRIADVVVLPTRLRESNPASAMDVAVKAGAPIVAPVNGVVTAVLPYNLYNKYPDVRIEIAPEGHPELQLTVLHVTGPLVNVGDQIQAGHTPLAASATLFPFESQIDRFSRVTTGGVHPHVHMEFKYR